MHMIQFRWSFKEDFSLRDRDLIHEDYTRIHARAHTRTQQTGVIVIGQRCEFCEGACAMTWWHYIFIFILISVSAWQASVLSLTVSSSLKSNQCSWCHYWTIKTLQMYFLWFYTLELKDHKRSFPRFIPISDLNACLFCICASWGQNYCNVQFVS